LHSLPGSAAAVYATATERRSGVRETGDDELILCNSACAAISSALSAALMSGFIQTKKRTDGQDKKRVWRWFTTRLGHLPQPAKDVSRLCPADFRLWKGAGTADADSRHQRFREFHSGCFLFYILSLFLMDKPVYYLPLLCYLVMGLFCAVGGSYRAGRLRLAPVLFFLFPVLHLSYGAGILRGFCLTR
jgi:hypothetical protein